MNENNRYQKGTIEISLGDLFWSVLRHWRGIIVFMLVFAVILGGLGFIKTFGKYRDTDARQKAQNDYEKAVETYNTNKAKLERDIKNSEEYQTHLEDYKDHCIFLRFDPYNIYKIETTFFVDSNYEINPSLSYQNINRTGTLIRSYNSAINRMDFESLIDMNGEDLTLRHPVTKYAAKKVCSVTIDENAGLLQLVITADTKERAEKLYNDVCSVIEETKAVLDVTVGEHEISVVNQSAIYTVDWDYETMQTSFTDDYFEKNKTKTSNLKQQLAELSEPKSGVLTKTAVLKTVFKRCVIGLIIGLIAAIAVYIAGYVLRDRVYIPDDIRRRYGLPVLGVVDLGLNGKKTSKADRKIAAKLGVPEGIGTEQAAGLVASNVKLYLKDAGKLLLIGSAGSKAADKLKELLEPLLPGTQIVSAGDVNSAPGAVDALASDTAVICVEEWQKARHLDIVHELDKISASENKGVGFVVVR